MTERFGDYIRGTKQIASSAVGLRSSENISLDRHIDEDSSDGVASVIVLSPENNKGDEDETEFPLITKVNRTHTGRHKEVASLNKQSYANLHQRPTEQTDIFQFKHASASCLHTGGSALFKEGLRRAIIL